MAVSDEWKTMGDFAPGLDTNRLPSTNALNDRELTFAFEDGASVTKLIDDDVDVVEVRSGIYFISWGDLAVPEGVVIVANFNTGRVLQVVSRMSGATNHIDPKVDQTCSVGDIVGIEASGDRPARSADLVGKRMFYRYSDTQAYEHIYVTSDRFAWHALEGPQRGHSDVELTNTFKIDENLYFFSWFEKIIPTCGNFVFDLDELRSTGFFFGMSAEGQPLTGKAGSYFEWLSTTTYPDGVQPA